MGEPVALHAGRELDKRLQDLHTLLMTNLMILTGWGEEHSLGLAAAALCAVANARWVVVLLRDPAGSSVGRLLTSTGCLRWPRWAAEAFGTAWLRVIHRLEIPARTADLLRECPTLSPVVAEVGLHDGVFLPIRTGKEELGVLGAGLAPDVLLDDHLHFVLELTAAQVAAVVEWVRLRRRLTETVATLERWRHVHSQLTRTVAAGQGLGPVVSILADLLGNPAAVLDPELRVRASAPASLAPDLFVTTARAARGGLTVQSLAVPEVDGRPLQALVAPVMAGNALLGYLCVLGQMRPLTPDDVPVVEEASTVLALELQKEETARQVERRLRGDLLGMLLHGDVHDRDALLERAAQLGFDLSRPHGVLVLQRKGGSAPKETSRLARLAEQVVPNLAPGALVGVMGQRVVCLVPLHCSREGDLRRRVAGRMVAAAAAMQPPLPVVVGIGRVCRELAHYPESFRQARLCLEVLERTGESDSIKAYEDLGLYRLAEVMPNSRVEELITDQLGPLWAYDRERNAQLCRTLLAYLESGCNVQKTARQLFVHVGTVRYRLRRIEEISGMDLRDPRRRLDLYVALKLAQLLTDSAHPRTPD